MSKIVAAIAALATIAFLTALNINNTLRSRASIAEEEVLSLRGIVERNNTALAEDTVRAKIATAKLFSMADTMKDIDAYVAALPDRDRECLSDADAGELRKLWED
jgi:hypothetical protein